MILQLLSILLLVGAAEADPVQLHTGGYVHILYKNDAGCVVYQKEDHLVTMTCPPSPCELKMKEAMKMADGKLFNRPPYTTPRSFEEREQRRRDDKEAWEQWDQVTEECVK